MKILFVTHGADMMGANRSMLNLISGLQNYGVESVILTPSEGKLIEAAQPTKVIVSKYHAWGYTKYLSKGYWLSAFRQRENEKKVKQIGEDIRAENFDIIYSNTSIIGIGAALADYLGIPHVWRIREFGEEDYNTVYWKGRTHFYEWANKAAAVSFISKAIQHKFEPYIHVPKYCIYNGIVSEKELNEIQPRSPQGTYQFLIIGLIHPNKGQFEALKAFHQVLKEEVDAKLLIVGKGRRLYTQRMRNYIKRHKLESKVELLGYVDNPHEVYQHTDCLLMCSKSEGMGRVTVEAMVHGKAVIGYNGGATPELVQQDKNGLLYSTREELSEAMLTLIRDPERSERYGQEGRKMAHKFVLEISAAKEYEVFKSILKKQ